MGRVVHFEFPVDDPERAMEFFKQAFGWNVEKWGEADMEYWLVGTGDRSQMGIDGGFMRRMENGPGPVNIIHMPDLDAAIAAVEKAGGKIVRPKMDIPTIGQIAYFADTEGNVWGIIQPAEGMAQGG